jgi:hypothetical protein
MKLGISMRKFGVELKKYATIHHYDAVNNKLKFLNKKPVRAWFGIRRVEVVDDIEGDC